MIIVTPKGETKATVSLQHEQLPDAAAADHFKAEWKVWLGRLKAVLEEDQPARK